MTLLELLVKELPKRGGWPKGIEKISQSPIDGELYLFKPCEILTGRGIYFFEVSDFCWTKVYKRQYEAAIAAQQTVWDGEGLPPVGCECEYETIKDNWRKCRVMYLGEKCNIVRTDEWGEVCCVLSVKFRPIVAEADRKRETSIAAMSEFFGHASGLYDLSGLYEEIAAGKIPGVELTK